MIRTGNQTNIPTYYNTFHMFQALNVWHEYVVENVYL
jgi:hypothetical protein